jgi:hypothetical protein
LHWLRAYQAGNDLCPKPLGHQGLSDAFRGPKGSLVFEWATAGNRDEDHVRTEAVIEKRIFDQAFLDATSDEVNRTFRFLGRDEEVMSREKIDAGDFPRGEYWRYA